MYMPPRKLGNGQMHSSLYAPTLLDGVAWQFRDEFDRDQLKVGWELDGGASFSATPPDIYDTTFAAGDVRMSLSQKPGWLLMQGPGTAATNAFFMLHPLAIGNDLVVLARLRCLPIMLGPKDNFGNAGIIVCNSANRATDKIICFTMDMQAGTYRGLFQKQVASSTTLVKETNLQNPLPYPIEYVALQKSGTDYSAWLGSRDGHWITMGTTTFNPAAAVDSLGFRFTSGADTGLGPAIFGADFIRAAPASVFPF